MLKKPLRLREADNGSNPTSGTSQAGGTDATSTSQADATTTSQASQAGAGTTTTTTKSADDYERMIAELRKENAGHRTKLKSFEDAEAQRQAAQLTEQQKLEKRALDAEKALTEREQAYQARLLDAEIRSQAAQLGIKYPDKAARLIDTTDIKADDAEMPAKVKSALTALLKEMPELAGKAQAPTSGGATNPSRSATGTQTITKDYISKLTPADYAAMTPEQKLEISRWIAGGGMMKRR